MGVAVSVGNGVEVVVGVGERVGVLVEEGMGVGEFAGVGEDNASSWLLQLDKNRIEAKKMRVKCLALLNMDDFATP
ncbi:MAG: hypothetical protein KDE56_24585 [Anaerolineales bacterium]|nr:hypothetical protein [Anaerolineales bacterium]